MITLTTEQAQQIEEAILDELEADTCEAFSFAGKKLDAALDTIRAARAQEQAEQKPVAWMQDSIEFYTSDKPSSTFTIPLYAAPVRTKDLTDYFINELWNTALMIADPTAGNLRFKFARAVIAADREKNK